MSTPITSSICGMGGARVAGSRYVQPPSLGNCSRSKGTCASPLPCPPPPPPLLLSDLLDHRGREFGELQQIEGRQDLFEACWVGEITDRQVVLTLDLCGKREEEEEDGLGGEGEKRE